jgi:hypothetical protein
LVEGSPGELTTVKDERREQLLVGWIELVSLLEERCGVHGY